MNNETLGIVVDGWNMSIASLFGSGPKLTIKCAACKRYYKDRVAPAKIMRAVCPHCGKLNRLDVTKE